MEASGGGEQLSQQLQFSVTMSDRERDELQKNLKIRTIRLRAELAAKKTAPVPSPVPLSQPTTPAPPKIVSETQKDEHKEKIAKSSLDKSTNSSDLVDELDPAPLSSTKSVPAEGERAWLCSECKSCEEFVVGSTKDVCAFCGCRLIYHLKTEEEYEIEALDDRELFEDAFDEFDEDDVDD